MLVIQHIWTQWTKSSRGANSPLQRPRLDEAYPLPHIVDLIPVVRHEIRVLEHENFEPVEEYGPVSRDQWERLQPPRDNALDWRLREDRVEIVIRKPSQERQQTKWPAYLPNPLFILKENETARIEWNGRFTSSMSGRNRATYYEQHIYWLALTREPAERLFLDASPKKAIDLRTEIY